MKLGDLGISVKLNKTNDEADNSKYALKGYTSGFMLDEFAELYHADNDHKFSKDQLYKMD